ncbi:MAG: FIST C-terminal domain-containing protein [Clostridiales bacterium]|jgi:hypothetical protein|nr:FIST C-terminal domain-containing protein [Clostridiales bacterium]
MLQFYSANCKEVNTKRAAERVIELAVPERARKSCRLALVNTAMGHRPELLADVLKAALPGVTVFIATGAGVTGRQGMGDSMHDLSAMFISGPADECVYGYETGFSFDNSYDKAAAMAKAIKEKQPEISVLYLLTPGIGTNNQRILQGVVSVFGEDVTVFGGTASDNGKLLNTYQYCVDETYDRAVFAVGFADKTLLHATRGTHGFTAYGEPLTVTKAEGNLVYEINGGPAWSTFLSQLPMDPSTDINAQLAFGAMGELLSDEDAADYGNTHLMRLILNHEGEVIHYPTDIKAGTKLWFTQRDEALIFSEQEKALKILKGQIGTGVPVAVFQTDCIARGRIMPTRLAREDLLELIQSAFLQPDGSVPPWLGNYGLGEFGRLGGKNAFHTYTTSLLILYRK